MLRSDAAVATVSESAEASREAQATAASAATALCSWCSRQTIAAVTMTAMQCFGLKSMAADGT